MSGQLWKDVDEINSLIRDLEKMESKLMNGQVILAYRDTGRILSNLKRIRERFVKEFSNNEE